MSSTPRGRPVKKKRGPEPKVSGKDGNIVGFRSLSVNSQWAYKRGISLESASKPEDVPGEEDNLPRRGRPPLDPEKGPMRSSSLKKRRNELNKERRKREHVSAVRRQAVSQRGDRLATAQEELEETGGDRELEPDVEPSERTAFRIKAGFFDSLPPSVRCQVELLVQIVKEGFLPELSIVTQDRTPQQTPRTSLYRYKSKPRCEIEIRVAKDCQNRPNLKVFFKASKWMDMLCTSMTTIA